VLELLTWTATGLGTGWLVRTAMRSRRDFGLLGDLITGWLGGLVGGWLFRWLGVIAPENIVGHVLVSLVGAVALLLALRMLRRATVAAQNVSTTAASAGLTLEERLRRLGNIERGVITSLLTRQPSIRDPNRAFDEQTTFGERIADGVALFGGSWTFIGLFFIAMFGWMALNEELARPFDPFPYILLNLVLSCLASLQAPVIMMSQNRQAARDRSDARSDYEVNVRAEMEILALHTKLDLLREQEWMRLARIIEEQQQTLARIEQRLGAANGPVPPGA